MSFGVLKYGERCDRHPVAKQRGMDARAIVFSDVSMKPPPPVVTGRRPVGPDTPPMSVVSSSSPDLSNTEPAALGTSMPPPAGSFMKHPKATNGLIDRSQQQQSSFSPATGGGIEEELRQRQLQLDFQQWQLQKEQEKYTRQQRPGSHHSTTTGIVSGKKQIVRPAGDDIFAGGSTRSIAGATLGTSSGLPKMPADQIAVLQQRQREKERQQTEQQPQRKLNGSQQSTPVQTPRGVTPRVPPPPRQQRTVKHAPSLKVNLKRKTPEEEVNAFNRVDFNGNGMLSLAELDKAIVELWPHFNNKPAIMRAYKAADANGTGFVSRKEFRLFLLFIQVFDTTWNVFSQLDTNGDRRLTKEEFLLGRPAMKQFGVDLSVQQMDTTFDLLDENHGGFVLFDEFCAVFAAEAVKREKQGFKVTKGNPAGLEPRQKVPQFLQLPSKGNTMTIFNRLDFNGNGMLSLAELDKAIVELWPQFNNKPAIMRAYKATDTNNSGFISKKEFRSFLQYLVVYQNLWDKFDAIDTSDDRRVSEEELLAGAKYVGPPISRMNPNELVQVFRSIDKNGGGFLLFDEFCGYFAAQAMELYKSLPHDDDPAEIACVGLPVFCHLCGHQFSHEMFDGHYQHCLEIFQIAVNELPSYLQFPVPHMSERFTAVPTAVHNDPKQKKTLSSTPRGRMVAGPPPTATALTTASPSVIPLPVKAKRTTPSVLEEFNAEARHLFLTETKRKCTECHLVLTVHALKVHFGAKHLKGLGTVREKELRRRHAEQTKAQRKQSLSPRSRVIAGDIEVKEPERLGKTLVRLVLEAGVVTAPGQSKPPAMTEGESDRRNIPLLNLRRALDGERAICPVIDRKQFTKVLLACRLEGLVPSLQLGKTFTKERTSVPVDTIMAQFPSTTTPAPKKKFEDPSAVAMAPTALAPPDVRKRMIEELQALGENKKAAMQAVSSGKNSSASGATVTGMGITESAQREATMKKESAGIVTVHCIAKFVGGSVEKIQIEDPTGTMKTDRASMLRRLRCAGYQDIQSLESIHVV